MTPRVDREVLSSHSCARMPTSWRVRASLVALALATALPLGLAFQGTRTAGRSVTGDSGQVASFSTAPGPTDVANLVTLVHRRCPQVRRLWLGDVATAVYVEVGTCVAVGDRERVRFARIAGVLPWMEGRNPGWIEVACTTPACPAPELGFPHVVTAARVFR